MARHTIDLSTVESIEELHARLARVLGLGPEYGRNLDALHDVLTESAEPRELVFRNSGVFWRLFPEYLPRFIQVALDSQDETDGLEVTFLP